MKIVSIPTKATIHSFKAATTAMTLTICSALAMGCGGAGQDAEEEEGSSSEAYSVGIDGCTLAAFTPGTPRSWDSPRAAAGTLNCPSSHRIQLKVCMQQLVTGGWQTLDWTCQVSAFEPSQGFSTNVTSKSVPYYTANRWYRSWAWGYADGANTAVVSAGCKGNGGSGCN
jgi:hypothetical protein